VILGHRPESFEVRPVHLRLLARSTIAWDDSGAGGWYLSTSNPYGQCPASAAGFDGRMSQAEADQLGAHAHQGTLYALDIILSTGDMRPGSYVLDTHPDGRQTWRRVR
jgi:hypothetical protein